VRFAGTAEFDLGSANKAKRLFKDNEISKTDLRFV
jgi:hypothetical protein